MRMDRGTSPLRRPLGAPRSPGNKQCHSASPLWQHPNWENEKLCYTLGVAYHQQNHLLIIQLHITLLYVELRQVSHAGDPDLCVICCAGCHTGSQLPFST